jgi:CheY-like chemotaxis protein
LNHIFGDQFSASAADRCITNHVVSKEIVHVNELKDRRIMIVEDNIVNMAVYSVAFKQSGATVIQDPFNTDTINMIKHYLPLDIILLDLMLRHHHDGYDVFDRLKTDPALSNIPVVAVSASDPAIEIPKAKKKGFAGFIGKPIDPFKLVEQIATCIKGEQVWYSPEEEMRGF